MATAITELNTDFYVPAYEVKVGGQPIDRQAVRDVLSVSYTDELDAIDSFSIVVNNWDEDRRELKYSENDLFVPGKRLELRLGYLDQKLTPMLVGEITSLQAQFPAAGPPTLTVTGLSILHRLRRKPRSEIYEQKTDSDIARQIAQQLGITIETKQGVQESVRPYVIQDNQQDILFLLQRARRIGYVLTVKQEREDGTPVLYFGPQSEALKAPFELSWGRSLLSFQPKLTTANQVGSVTVRAWHPTAKKLIEGKASRNDVVGGEPFADAFNERHEIIADRPVKDKAEADEYARETLRRIAQSYVTASASTIGLPQLRTGTRVEVTGTGRHFSGLYFLTSSTHAIGDSGYVTSFKARKEPE
jgi:uncharacterized protein